MIFAFVFNFLLFFLRIPISNVVLYTILEYRIYKSFCPFQRKNESIFAYNKLIPKEYTQLMHKINQINKTEYFSVINYFQNL
jgi:hypothetical protein